ncbi:MAG: ATP-binding cassette domain-containing protein, partial [Coriobacteriaceae bacterium]|nr:ATP-binding cassette domain-containing protein [Coriobacteriaceae bacterium]
NGCGKTTLARIACGRIVPDAGSVGPALASSYCPQDATLRPAGLDDFAAAYDGRAVRLRRELGIEDDWPWRFETLSGGQQKRLQVACAIWPAPDLLVMDEPTNHVDATTRAAIARALAGFAGVGILISHDRALLDALCAQCLFMSEGSAVMRPGGYTKASGQEGLERAASLHAHEEARREKKRIEREAQRRREEAARKEGKKSLKGISKHDSDARHKKRLAIVTSTDGIAAKQAGRMEARLERVTAQADRTRVQKRYDADIWLEATPSRRPVLLRLEAAELPMGERTLVFPPLFIGRSDHIGLVGDNGSGKTTLVKHLMAHMPGGVRVLYIPQEPTESQQAEARERLTGLASAERGRVLSIVAQLNSEPERILEGDAISPGEMRKLMLALGILDSPELIIMDEPTNHLDLGSTEALERVLAAFPGALLLVSHDAALLEATTSITWRIDEGDTVSAVSCG